MILSQSDTIGFFFKKYFQKVPLFNLVNNIGLLIKIKNFQINNKEYNMKEIERKFLVEQKHLNFLQTFPGKSIKQAYIQNKNDRTVRVRISDRNAFLTIKIGTESINRDEFEYQIPVRDALSMMEIMNLKVLTKIRYEIIFEHHLWEVDVFEGKLDGLIIAEIELKSEDEFFDKPNWLGIEVTYDPLFLNAKLIEKL